MLWHDWPLSRMLLLFTGIALILLFLQTTLFHTRQNFRHWTMWSPVLQTAVTGLLCMVLVFFPIPWLQAGTALLLAVGFLLGLAGFILHTKGVGDRVGDYTFNNFLVGPPVILPLMAGAINVLGLLALYWR